ncbi:MAG: hypothetical protein Q8R24_01165 [Legionellaceae bacterium]|nr:hypothetical protein [Legionellaceae bacterium]
MTKHAIKFSLGAVGLVIVGFGVLFVLRYLNPENRQMREAERIIKELKRQEREDPYGGVTPEETLQLFIEALKKGDTDLAAKYFVFDLQKKWKDKLDEAKNKGLLDKAISDLERAEKSKVTDKEAYFVVVNEKNIVSMEIIMVPNPHNGKWKILEL